MNKYNELLVDAAWMALMYASVCAKDMEWGSFVLLLLFLPITLGIVSYIPKKLKGDKRVWWFSIIFYLGCYVALFVFYIIKYF